MPDPIVELVPITQPLFLDENLKPFQCAIVGVEQNHGQGRQLGGSIPAVATVNNDTGLMIFYLNKSDISFSRYIYEFPKSKLTFSSQEN